MTVEYRLMRPDEEPALQDFFLATYTAYPDEGRRNYLTWKSLLPSHTRTHVALAADRRILASVVTWYRQVRDAHGTPQRVGHLSHVVTRMDARRQGHASRLIEQAITAMQQDGCAWSSLLTASATGRVLYERYGWSRLALPFWRGVLMGHRPGTSASSYHIKRYDRVEAPDTWATLAAIYADYNALRPLGVVRDEVYWETFTAAQLAPGLRADRVSILTAHNPVDRSDVCGYVFLHISDEAFVVSEIGVRSGDEAAILPLLAAAAEAARQRGVVEGEWLLPQTPSIAAALERLCGASLERAEIDAIMARPIAPYVSDSDVAAIFTAPGAIWWRLDMV